MEKKYWKETKQRIVVSLLMGILIASGLKIVSAGFSNWEEYVFIIVACIALLLSIELLFDFHNRMRSELTFIRHEAEEHIHLHDIETKYIGNSNGTDYGYIESFEQIKKASKAIYIVGDYSPSDQSIDSSRERLDYFLAIEEVIEKHIKSNSYQEFKYVRIMQRNEADFKRLEQNSNNKIVKLSEEHLNGDEDGFQHCMKILKMKKDNFEQGQNVEIRLYVSKFVPSLPSILIVDEKHLLFTIPKKRPPLEGQNIITAGVIHFMDNKDGNSIVNSFKSIFESIRADSIEVAGISGIE